MQLPTVLDTIDSMTDENNELAKGGNLWLPEEGARTAPVNHRKPRWLRIALVWGMGAGFVILTALYTWDYFNTLTVNAANRELFTKALASGETTFSWRAGGLPPVMEFLLWIPLFILSFTGFPTARKLLAGDHNKRVAKAWRWIALLHIIMIISLFPRLFVGNDAPEEVLKDKGYSVAEMSSNFEDGKSVLAIAKNDGDGVIYRAEKITEPGTYELKLPKELVDQLNSSNR